MKPEPHNLVCDVAVVGAGPAGLLAAIAAANHSARVLVVERMEEPGRKLLASGGGRCNLGNTLPTDQFLSALGRQGRFAAPALEAFSSATLVEFFASIGVETFCPDGKRLYPASESAAQVQQALLQRCSQLGVKILPRTQARAVRVAPGGASLSLETSAGEFAAPTLLLAAGGKGYRQLGSDGSGYELARQAGHSIVTPLPALCPLICREGWPARCMGVGLKNARVRIDAKGASKAGVVGDVLFTHRGVSGPAVLDLSGDVAALLKKQPQVALRIAPLPELSAGGWLERFDQWRSDNGTKFVRSMLALFMPAALVSELFRLAQLDEETLCSMLPKEPRQALAHLLEGIPLTITATEGFDAAMVTRGGVRLGEVDPRTMESKLVEGLYFAGEILDLDGPSGGFNLHLAFATGFLAGRSAAQRKR